MPNYGLVYHGCLDNGHQCSDENDKYYQMNRSETLCKIVVWGR